MSQIVRRCILINGTMGAGKTTVCKELMRLLPHSAFLDGDWCWYSDPFTVNDRTKEMVLQNIGFVLSNFLRCPDYQNILFCWVMDRQEILDEVIRRHPNPRSTTRRRSFSASPSQSPRRRCARGCRGTSTPVCASRILWSAALRGCRCTGSCPPGRWMSPTFLPSRRRGRFFACWNSPSPIPRFEGKVASKRATFPGRIQNEKNKKTDFPFCE